MKCHRCGNFNSATFLFCSACGQRLSDRCPECDCSLPSEARFCPQCGFNLQNHPQVASTPVELLKPDSGQETGLRAGLKYVTVLFSDLSGYTSLSERLEPEDVDDIIKPMFSKIADVIERYNGRIEKYIGDAVMAVFGIDKTSEDDPIRAIYAAREIHALIGDMGRQTEKTIGMPLSMHSGINSGLVVTGNDMPETGRQSVVGDTVNLASRLCSISKKEQILVGPDTYLQARSHFRFDTRQTVKVKGKTASIHVYEVLEGIDRPHKIHRLCGLRSVLIGRKVEMTFLKDAYDGLLRKKGAIFAIHGTAGTGKSRLVKEFKSTLDLSKVQWLSGHAYPSSYKVPYFPLIDLLNNALNIEENDPAKKVRRKIEVLIHNLVGKKDKVVPYIGRLYNIEYPEAATISPEAWKVRLHEAILEILTAYAKRAPTIVCMEDLHWADPSSLELIRYLVSDFNYAVVFLCVFRPDLNLFSGQHIHSLGGKYREIRLQDLSLSETQDMIASLLATDSVPPDLMRTIHEQVEGNPFYIEEMINSLIDSDNLVHHSDGWQLTKDVRELAIPLTIQGVISGRLDRLEPQMKRILQESAVIGRSFLYDILKKITQIGHQLDYYLSGLEQTDLIKLRSYQPELEYLFKHALTQDVVYQGLLKKERRTIHERIGRVIEQLYTDRLPEFYETLAFHFRRGVSTEKAALYLARSGSKCLRRFALKEAHDYYSEAYELILQQTDPDPTGIIDLLNQWSFVYYYRGHYKKMLQLLLEYKDRAEALPDKNTQGMFFAWLGCGLWHRERFSEARQTMQKALELGRAADNKRLVGYACSWLSWIFTELGMIEEALTHSDRAQQICGEGKQFPYIYVNSLAGKGYASWHSGDRRATAAAAEALLAYGASQADIRSKVMGHCCMGWSHLIAGRLDQATACFRDAMSVSNAPWYTMFPKLALTYGSISMGQFHDAAAFIDEIIAFSREHGAEFAGTPAAFFNGVLMVADGKINRGIEAMERQLAIWAENGCRLRETACGFILARVYAAMLQKKGLLGAAKIMQNINFFLKRSPSLARRADAQFESVIRLAKSIGANNALGQAYLYWGLLHRDKNRTAQARQCFSEAIRILTLCGAEGYTEQARAALDDLDR